jgi:hypothetical protein
MIVSFSDFMIQWGSGLTLDDCWLSMKLDCSLLVRIKFIFDSTLKNRQLIETGLSHFATRVNQYCRLDTRIRPVLCINIQYQRIYFAADCLLWDYITRIAVKLEIFKLQKISDVYYYLQKLQYPNKKLI